MQFTKVLLPSLFVFMVCCWQSALTARLHHKGRSALLKIYPQHRRKLQAQGRSTSASDSVLDVGSSVLPAHGEESRGLMEKFKLFKSLFYQQKSEPTHNIIIITQPTLTDTTASDTPTTTTGTTDTSTPTAASSPIITNAARDSKAEDETDGDHIKELENSQAEEIVQKVIKHTQKPKKWRLNKLTKFNTKNLEQQQQQQQQKQRKRRLRRRNQVRIRLPLPTQQSQPHQSNSIDVENLPTNMNLTKKPNQHSKNNSNNNDDNEESNNHNNNNSSNNKHNNNNNASGILNLNTNMRLQNIMNVFRKQTPIMYNY